MTNTELLCRAAKNFFAQSGQLCPEAMIHELEHLKESLPLIASDHQSVQDLLCTRLFLESLVDFIKECSEASKG